MRRADQGDDDCRSSADQGGDDYDRGADQHVVEPVEAVVDAVEAFFSLLSELVER